MWIALTVVVALIAALVAYALMKPALKRKRAVRQALQKARAAADNDPSDFAAKIALARVHLELAEDPAEALRIVQQVQAAEPLHWSGEKPARMIEGEAYVAMGQLDKAIETFQSFVARFGDYASGLDSERKWRLETHKVDAEQRIRLLKQGDTHVHRPEQWGDDA